MFLPKKSYVSTIGLTNTRLLYTFGKAVSRLYFFVSSLTSKFLILSIFHDLLICNYYLIKSTLFLVYNTPFILLSLKKLLLTLISMTSGVIILVGYFPSYLEGAIDIPYVFGTQNFISKCLFYFIS